MLIGCALVYWFEREFFGSPGRTRTYTIRLTDDALHAAGKARHGWDPGCAENRGILAAREAGMIGFLGGQKQREFDLLSGAWAATCV